MATNTTSYAFKKPTVDGDDNDWGGFLNDNFDSLDDLLDGTTTVDGIDVDNMTGTASDLDINAGTQDGCTYTDANVTANRVETTGEIKEGVQTLTGTSPAINPSSGTISKWTLGAASSNTPTFSMNDGESVMVHIQTSTGSITWPAVTWMNGEPTLVSSTLNVVQFWQVDSVVYGAFVGST